MASIARQDHQHPIDPRLRYVLRVKPIYGCAKCGEMFSLGERKDCYVVLPLRPCPNCGVARYCSNLCRISHRRPVTGASGPDSKDRHADVCKPPSDPNKTECVVRVGDVDHFQGQASYRQVALGTAFLCGLERLRNRPFWTFKAPSYLVFDYFAPGRIWLGDAKHVFNGHIGLMLEVERVRRILYQSSPKYQFFVFGIDAINRIVDMLVMELEDPPEKKEEPQPQAAGRRKKK